MNNIKTPLPFKNELLSEFETWWNINHSELNEDDRFGMSLNVVRMIKVVSRAAWLAASEPYIDMDKIIKNSNKDLEISDKSSELALRNEAK